MTKEGLEKEASDYALEWADKSDGTYACCRDGYLAGAEPREKRIEELEQQIEKMKCCANCAFEYPKTDGNSEICRRCRRYTTPFTEWKLDEGRSINDTSKEQVEQ